MDIDSTIVRGSGSPPAPGAGWLLSGSCAAIAAASACVSRRASSRVLGRPMHSGSGKGLGEVRGQADGSGAPFYGGGGGALSSPGAVAEHWRSDSICRV